MLAASNGYTETVLALIAANADVLAKNKVSEVFVEVCKRKDMFVCILSLCVVTLCAPCASSA